MKKNFQHQNCLILEHDGKSPSEQQPIFPGGHSGSESKIDNGAQSPTTQPHTLTVSADRR